MSLLFFIYSSSNFFFWLIYIYIYIFLVFGKKVQISSHNFSLQSTIFGLSFVSLILVSFFFFCNYSQEPNNLYALPCPEVISGFAHLCQLNFTKPLFFLAFSLPANCKIYFFIFLLSCKLLLK